MSHSFSRCSAFLFLSLSHVLPSCGVHFTWHSAGFCPSPGFSPSLLLSISLCLSIVHNYTIRLLNRLMRPPLPVVAAPFTETTGRARASLLSLPPVASFRLARVLEILKLSPTYPFAYFFPARVCPLACPDFFLHERFSPSIHALFYFQCFSLNIISNMYHINRKRYIFYTTIFLFSF